jgi:hypothetical protein
MGRIVNGGVTTDFEEYAGMGYVPPDLFEPEEGLEQAREADIVSNPTPFVRVGSFMIPQVNALALTALTVTINVAYLFPLPPLADDFSFDQIAGYNTTGIASGACRLGIYSEVTPGKPDGGALLHGTGNLSTVTTSTSAMEVINKTFSKGTRLWLAALYSHAAGVRAMAIGGIVPLGTDSAMAGLYSHVRFAHAYAALPDVCPATTLNTGSVPAVGLRRSA